MKKLIKIILLVLLVLLVAAFAAPYLFKPQIITLVKKEINKNINASVDFTDVDISFFRHFPKVAVGLDGLRIIGNAPFTADTLLFAKRIDAAVNITSIISGKDMTIYSITVSAPRIHAIVNKDSLTNWDILKPDSTAKTTAEAKPFKLALQQYALRNAYLMYTDATANIATEIINLTHEGTGDFTADLFTLNTNTTADSLTVAYNGIPYLSKIKAAVVTDISVDNRNNIYQFKSAKIKLNDLAIDGEGAIKNLAEKGYDMDIRFKAPSADFKNILSLVPAIYATDFSKMKTSGTASFSGFVKGIYNQLQLPAYQVNLEVANGFFQYPDLPKPLQRIGIKAQVNNPDGITDHTVINITQAHAEMDNEPFDIRLLIKNPISNLFVDAAAKGKLDLAKIAQLVKLTAGTKMSGLLQADMFVKGNVKDIEQQKFNQFTAGGTINLNNFLYLVKDYPTGIKINTLQTSFTPAKVNITSLNGQYLNSNFTGSGQINNLLNYMLQNKPLNASLNISADKINLNDWMGTSTDTVTSGAVAKPFVVPANLNVLVNTSVDQLHYDHFDMSNLSGSLKINDETVTIAEVKGNALDGAVLINGSYSTKTSKLKPDIAFLYSVDKVDVQKTFAAFNTVQLLMPIGKFIAGKLSSQLSVKGKLGDNMMPELSSLTGNGNLLLIEGFLSKFAPLDKIASTLKVKALEQISVKDIKTFFEFSEGKVLVKPFAVKISGINMQVGGVQGFDQSMNYIIDMKLPRALMGEQGNQLVNNLVSQVNSKGVPLKLGDIVNLNLQLGGTFKNPTIKTDLKQTVQNVADQLKEQALGFAKAKFDSSKQAITHAVKDTIASVKKQAINVAREELAKKLLNKGSDTSKAKPTPQESIKGLMNNLFKKKKDSR